MLAAPMRLIAAGAGVMLVALGLLFAMVVRALEPGLALSFLSYAGLFAGMMLALAGAVRRARSRR
jgi:hypothetical protein